MSSEEIVSALIPLICKYLRYNITKPEDTDGKGDAHDVPSSLHDETVSIAPIPVVLGSHGYYVPGIPLTSEVNYFLTAIETNACIRCAFRYLNISTTSLYCVDYEDLVSAVIQLFPHLTSPLLSSLQDTPPAHAHDTDSASVPALSSESDGVGAPPSPSRPCAACGGCLTGRVPVSYHPEGTLQYPTGPSQPPKDKRGIETDPALKGLPAPPPPQPEKYFHVKNWHQVVAATTTMSGWDLRSGVSFSIAMDKDYLPQHDHRYTCDLMHRWRAKTTADRERLLKPMRDLKDCVRGMLKLAFENAFVEKVDATAERFGLPSHNIKVVTVPEWDETHVRVDDGHDARVWVDLGTGYADLQRESTGPELLEDRPSALLHHNTADIPHMENVKPETQAAFRLSLTIALSPDGICIPFIVERFPLFLRGRYCKYARGVAQTAWWLQGARMGADTSVEEIIAGTVARCFSPDTKVEAMDYAAPALSTLFKPLAPFVFDEVLKEEPRPTTSESEKYVKLMHACVPATFRLPGCVALDLRADGMVEEASASGDALTEAVRYFLNADHLRQPQPPISIFHAAGREDIDVRMLGSGRPCIVEVVNAKRGILVPAVALIAMQNAINTYAAGHGDAVEMKGFAPSLKEEFQKLQDGAMGKRKRYAAVVWAEKPFTLEQLRAKLCSRSDIELQQLTPMRVMHRRSLMARRKVVHDMDVSQINPHFFTLFLTTSAGTYVKEFVHGDLGRTQPNVGSLLGCGADIMQLDVVDLLYGGEGDSDDEDGEDDVPVESTAKRSRHE